MSIEIDALALAQALIRRPSVTPKDAGALDILERVLKELGFVTHRLPFGDVDNLYARLGEAAPHFCFAGHTDVVPVGEGSVLSMGVYLSGSTKIVDRATGEVHLGKVPPYSVVVSGSMPSGNGPNLYCAVIVKKVDEKTRAKTSINELLRD